MAVKSKCVWLIAAGFLAAGCGDNLDGGADAGPGPGPEQPDAAPEVVELADICDEQTGVFVEIFDTFLSCSPELELLLGTLPDRAELAALCEGGFQPFVDDRTVQVGDIGDLQACRAFVDELTCESFSIDDLRPCEGLFRGMVEIGGDCDDDVQCAGDAFCDSAGMGCGMCTARLPDGATCIENSECTSRNCSDPDNNGLGSCRELGDIGSACAINDDCRGRLICDRSAGTCAAEPDWVEGTPCAEFPLDCRGLRGDLFCNSMTNQCEPYRHIGQTCNPTVFPQCRVFQSETCQDVGGGDFQCVAPQGVATGQPCGFVFGLACKDGDTCIDHDADYMTQEICVRPVGAGGDCSASESVCGGLLECVGDTCQYGLYTGMCPAGA